jgi:hypothetical protein
MNQRNDYDAILVAVPHKQYMAYEEQDFMALCNKKAPRSVALKSFLLLFCVHRSVDGVVAIHVDHPGEFAGLALKTVAGPFQNTF